MMKDGSEFQRILAKYGVDRFDLIRKGIKGNSIVAYWKGTRSVGLEQAKRIQELVGIPVGEFFPGVTWVPPAEGDEQA